MGPPPKWAPGHPHPKSGSEQELTIRNVGEDQQNHKLNKKTKVLYMSMAEGQWSPPNGVTAAERLWYGG